MKNIEVKPEFLDWINDEIANIKYRRDHSGSRREKLIAEAELNEIYFVKDKLKECMVVRTSSGEEFN